MLTLLRLFHTLRHLRLRQVAYQLFYRATGRLAATGAQHQAPDKHGERGTLTPLVANFHPPLPTRQTSPTTFTFLNRTVVFPAPTAVNWNEPRHGKLWTYNLNYFEFLRQPTCPEGPELIAAWIAKEATHRDGWEPYPISLRLVNWLQYFRKEGKGVPPAVHASVGRQYRALVRKIEYHLDGNHLLENLLALRITARYLGREKDEKRFGKMLTRLRREQYLADGAHYERSVMYHAVLLLRWLDYYTWFPEEEATRANVGKQLGWLEYMVTKEGRYPHFNDSTDGIAPEISVLFRYAESLGLKPVSVTTPSAGYYRFPAGEFTCWVDAAPIGPDHIPGHAHADNLTFVLDHRGAPLCVDTGISTYEKNARRAHERSTAAHNTVEVNGRNSSDVWGGFRVGKRARTQVQSRDEQALSASHNGYAEPHHRAFAFAKNKITITDRIGEQTGTARFHFHESAQPVLTGNELTTATGVTFRWRTGTASLLDYQRATGFNQLTPAKVLTITFTGELKTTIESTISYR